MLDGDQGKEEERLCDLILFLLALKKPVRSCEDVDMDCSS
jgi:hypothetical protein